MKHLKLVPTRVVENIHTPLLLLPVRDNNFALFELVWSPLKHLKLVPTRVVEIIYTPLLLLPVRDNNFTLFELICSPMLPYVNGYIINHEFIHV